MTLCRSRAALEARPCLRVEWLPTYAPELNAIERCWRDLKRHYLANQTFRDGADLERRARAAVHRRNLGRAPHLWLTILIACLSPSGRRPDQTH